MLEEGCRLASIAIVMDVKEEALIDSFSETVSGMLIKNSHRLYDLMRKPAKKHKTAKKRKPPILTVDIEQSDSAHDMFGNHEDSEDYYMPANMRPGNSDY